MKLTTTRFGLTICCGLLLGLPAITAPIAFADNVASWDLLSIHQDSMQRCIQIVDASQAKTLQSNEGTDAAKADAGNKAEDPKAGPKSEANKPEAEKPQKKATPKRKLGIEAVRKALPVNGTGFINDQAIQMFAEAQVNRMIKSGNATSLKELKTHFDRVSCELKLPVESKAPVTSEELYLDQRKSIVVIMISRKHNDHWHVVMAATGFMITKDGAMVTNRHVVESEETNQDEYLFAMTSDGRVHRVKSVLASNKANDAAICQIVGSDFNALPLRSNTPVGSPVRVISHPKGRLYTLSEGLVSRRYARSTAKRKRGESEKAKLDLSKTTKWVTVTADFGKGSSGAPILDRFGNAIGIAAMTSNVVVDKNDDAISQMVFRDCAPAEIVLEMIKPAE